ncbi:MAG: tail fiber domain-containing protein, partial [Patescibacteria group bacterium]|nr:tail fiber domain-containing protein [Patescibacteria group bacterium]
SGNVGIGTTGPAQKFHVSGNSILDGKVGLGDSGDSALNATTLQVGVRSAHATTGVTATSENTIRIVQDGGNNIMTSLQFGQGNMTTAGVTALVGALQTSLTGNGLADLVFATKNATGDADVTERMRILSTGNVGIGTASPGAGLDVRANAGRIMGNALYFYGSGNHSDGMPYARLIESWGMRFANPDNRWVLSTAGSLLVGYQPAGTDYGSGNLLVSGNVGIGTTGPGANLDIQRVAGDSSDILRIGSNQNFYFGFARSNSTGALNIQGNQTGNNNIVLAPTSGNVGIGTTSPWRTLSVAGTVGFNSSLTQSSTGDYLCINTGTFEVSRGNGAACSTSSKRFKEQIVDLSYGLAAVLDLRPVSFIYKPEMNVSTSTRIGFIAEEMYETIPEVVNLDRDGLPSGIDYPTLTAVLAKAIQELSAKVENLQETSQSSGSFGLQTLIDALKQVGIYLEEGLVRVTQLIAEKVTAKRAVFEEVELKDKTTGVVYCIRVEGGVLTTSPGGCSAVSPEPTPVPSETGFVTEPELSSEPAPGAAPPPEETSPDADAVMDGGDAEAPAP